MPYPTFLRYLAPYLPEPASENNNFNILIPPAPSTRSQTMEQTRQLTSLPPELLHNVLLHLSDIDLVQISQTCRYFATLSSDDRLWHRILQNYLPLKIDSLPPEQRTEDAYVPACPSYKDLYTLMHPFWFLPQRKLWFSDTPMHGKLIIPRYDPRRGAIEAYSLNAERGDLRWGTVNWGDGTPVEYYSFHPKVQLDLNQPVVSLKISDVMRARAKSAGIPQEVQMGNGSKHRVSSTLLLSKTLPNEAITSSTQVWPPLSVPAYEERRTRNTSHNSFRSSGFKPSKPSEVSDSTFRVRQWAEFNSSFPAVIGRYMGAGGRVGEHVTTYGTLCENAYTPSKDKPWQGIWVGDYSAHGCEFLLVTQPENPQPLPDHARKAALEWPHMDGNMPFSQSAGGNSSQSDEIDLLGENEVAPGSMHFVRQVLAGNKSEPKSTGFDGPLPEDSGPYRGRLEAIKLTGDPNVPRGEYSFIADLGSTGALGYTKDPIFEEHAAPLTGEKDSRQALLPQDSRGFRIVKSIGHIATQAFTTDSYIPTQLILVNENTMAQYWEPFGHISFYRRVDTDRFLTA